MLKSSRSLRTSLLPEPLARLEFIRCSETTVPAARAVPPPLREVVRLLPVIPSSTGGPGGGGDYEDRTTALLPKESLARL
jgi:hypothetical protein